MGNSSPEFARELCVTLMGVQAVQQVHFERGGLRWRSDIGDEVGRQLYVTGSYEGREIAAVLEWLQARRPNGVVVDVGANLGTTSIPFALAGFRVLAIEPVPGTFAMLKANVSANHLADQVTCLQFAVGDNAGEVVMSTGTGSGQGEVVPDHMSSPTIDSGVQVSVPVAPLRELMAKGSVSASEVALVWADVQGCEASVIRTGAALWAEQVPLWLEVDPSRLERHGGLVSFCEAVRSHFGEFISCADLLAGRAEREIGEFDEWVSEIVPGKYTDALLIPRA